MDDRVKEIAVLKSVLAELMNKSGGEVYYVPNEGNAGDALIAAGMWCLFSKVGLIPKIIRTEDICPGMHVMYSGGGNFVDGYSECKNFLLKCLEVGAAEVVVLPHTIRSNLDVLGKLDERFTLFCREYKSYDWALQHAPGARKYLADDLAFSLDLEWLEREVSGSEVWAKYVGHLAMSPKQMIKYVLWYIKKKRVVPTLNGALEIYRVDCEATAEKKGVPALDLSNLYGSKYMSRAEALIITWQFLSVLKKAKIIATNRLHVSVGGALLGVKVLLNDNSYGKNGDIYDKTLAERFDVEMIRG
ncbi:polysaccharide pyruvyl transferase family protein [Aquabacterium sp.]|uniref:polysaccharide pyruvyl transferase family protein n=1 Tax=Aquabacterium sp. TaxID=1872578 RepID=UPI0025BF8F5F|nr:polysaccharide pyruvyl transferase family protein [Aquabacterium sp.]